MDVKHYVFQFWRIAKQPMDDRLLYEIIGEDVSDAKRILCDLMKWKRVPKKLQIRIAFVVMSSGI